MSEQLIQTPGVFGENGNFLLERELGSGGMGGVYMGRDKMLDRPVAVKVMLKELGSDAEFVEKFKREAQAAARLIHPNIAQVYSYGICDGMPYIAMELAAGGSLFSLMNANPGRADVTRVVKICQQVAQALQCAADQGLVHGDVKPENILFDANGNAKLVDFGLAAMQKDTEDIWGTPYYIAPEKVNKEAVDFRADMYSLGGTLYHALTGVAPFEGEDSIAVVKKRFEGNPKKPSEIRSELSPALDKIVMTMLAINKEDRYPSFEALLQAFRDALTNGLTVTPSAAATSAPSAKKTLRTAGVRRMRTTLRSRTQLAKKTAEDASEAEAISDIPAVSEDEEEEEGNLGAKVIGSVVGVLLLIALVIGGLVWYQIADKRSREADEQAQINTGLGKARDSIANTLDAASKFADNFDELVQKAVAECQKPTDELMKILPEEHRKFLKPEPSRELLDAIASTNKVAVAEESDKEKEKEKEKEKGEKDGDEAKEKKVLTRAHLDAAKKLATKVPKFREPTEDEKDPASPEGEAYLKAKKAFLEEQGKKADAPAEKSEKGAEEQPSGQSAAAAADEPAPELPPVVLTMNELWEKAYSCQACSIRVRAKINKILEKGQEVNATRPTTRESMTDLAALASGLIDMLEQVKGSPDVEKVKKAVSLIRTKGEKAVAGTLRQIKLDKLKAEREAKAAKAKADEEARLKKIEEERKARVESETTAAKEKFELIVNQGCLRQLDWKTALRQLEAVKSEATTPEGQLAIELEIRKVMDMKMVQDIFIKNLSNYVFKSGKLRNLRIDKINASEIVLPRPKGKVPIKLNWPSFYKDYTRNLNDLINTYVVNTRKPNSSVNMTLREWADAMTGAALTMQIICAEAPGAAQRSQELMKMVVERFPDYGKTAKEIFPDLPLDTVSEE